MGTDFDLRAAVEVPSSGCRRDGALVASLLRARLVLSFFHLRHGNAAALPRHSVRPIKPSLGHSSGGPAAQSRGTPTRRSNAESIRQELKCNRGPRDVRGAVQIDAIPRASAPTGCACCRTPSSDAVVFLSVGNRKGNRMNKNSNRSWIAGSVLLALLAVVVSVGTGCGAGEGMAAIARTAAIDAATDAADELIDGAIEGILDDVIPDQDGG